MFKHVLWKLGITSIDVDIKSRIILYLTKLVSEDQGDKLHMVYSLLYKLDELNIKKEIMLDINYTRYFK